jgi:hypothetical protein
MSDEAVFVLSIVVLTISVPHTITFWLAGRWHAQNVNLVREDRERYRVRVASPPWYVRYSARILRHQLDPDAPKRMMSQRQARRVLRRTTLSQEDQAMILEELELAREAREGPTQSFKGRVLAVFSRRSPGFRP